MDKLRGGDLESAIVDDIAIVVNDVRDYLVEGIEKLRSGDLTPAQLNARSRAVGKKITQLKETIAELKRKDY